MQLRSLAREAAPFRVEIGWITAVAPTSVGATVTPARPAGRDVAGLPRRGCGYDAPMSESSNETGNSPDSSPGSDGPGRGITDDQLPDDLNPKKNPLARDPGDEGEEESGPTTQDPAGP